MSHQFVRRLGPCAFKHYVQKNASLHGSVPRRQLASIGLPLVAFLQRVQDGTLSPVEASKLIEATFNSNNDQVLESFANLDHERSKRTGFPEAVFAEGKTATQVASILDDMARSANESTLRDNLNPKKSIRNAILATRYVVVHGIFGELRWLFSHRLWSLIGSTVLFSRRCQSTTLIMAR
jgi:hypothetical protein